MKIVSHNGNTEEKQRTEVKENREISPLRRSRKVKKTHPRGKVKYPPPLKRKVLNMTRKN